MSQTTPFWGFIAYLLSFLGCGGGYYDNIAPVYPDKKVPTTIEVDHKTIYDQSLIVWDLQKEEHNNSYEYSLSFGSEEARYESKSTFIIKEGIITKHDFESYHYNNNNEKNIDKVWTEEKDKIGSHKEGFPAKTLDEIYKDCGNTYLTVKYSENYVYLETEHEGVISLCGYFPRNCADDCFEGVKLKSFNWLD